MSCVCGHLKTNHASRGRSAKGASTFCLDEDCPCEAFQQKYYGNKNGLVCRVRKHSEPIVGGRVGCATVLEILPRDYTSNLRLRVRCDCGREMRSYEFNLRRRTRCGHRGHASAEAS
jgi:hypothetical protein